MNTKILVRYSDINIPCKEDMIKCIDAYLFCLLEKLEHKHPELEFSLPYAEINMIQGAVHPRAFVRVFAVDDPYQLGLQIEDAVFTMVWDIHSEEYGWYPENEDVDVENDVVSRIKQMEADAKNRVVGRTFKDKAEGMRAYIALGRMVDRTAAGVWMTVLGSYFAEREEI